MSPDCNANLNTEIRGPEAEVTTQCPKPMLPEGVILPLQMTALAVTTEVGGPGRQLNILQWTGQPRHQPRTPPSLSCSRSQGPEVLP